MMIEAGGAVRDRRDNLLMNEAKSADGRCLKNDNVSEENPKTQVNSYVELKNNSVNLKKRALCFKCKTSPSRKA